MKMLMAVIGVLILSSEIQARELNDWRNLHKVVSKPVLMEIQFAPWVRKDTGELLDVSGSSFSVTGSPLLVWESSAVVKIEGFADAPLSQYPYSVLALCFLFGGQLELVIDKKEKLDIEKNKGKILYALTVVKKGELLRVTRKNGVLKRILTLGIAREKTIYQYDDTAQK